MSGGSGTGTPVIIPAPIPTTAFEDMLAADLSAVFFNAAEFAKAISYTPSGGLAIPITVVLSEEDLSGQSPVAPGDTMIVLAKFADIALPGRGDAFLINAETWYFVENVAGGRAEGVWHIRVTRSARRMVGERTYL